MGSILSAIKEYISACPFLDELAGDNIHIDFNSEEPTNYALSQTGDTLLKKYVNGSQQRQANFSIYIKNFTFDDTKRLENSGFCEHFIFWLEDNRLKDNLPTLDVGLCPLSVSAENGTLFDVNENGDIGTYQIQIHLIYRRN